MNKFCVVLFSCLMLFCAVTAFAQDTAEVPMEKQIMMFTINGIDYCLGTSTVQDLVMNGWAYTVENDGTYAFYDSEFESYFYVVTSAGAADDPIVIIDLMWADGVPAAYCGFVADQETEGNENALMKWLTENFEAETNEEGTLVAQRVLSDGNVLQVETKDTRVRLSLTAAEQPE